MIFPPDFFQQLFNGIVIGSIYALIAIGLSLIFGVMKVINFAHGELYMLGAYVTFFGCQFLGLHPLISMLLAMLIIFTFGMLIERSSIYYIRKRRSPDLHYILLTFGLSIFLMNVALVLWGPIYRKSPPILTGVVTIFGVTQSYQRLLTIFISLAIILVLHLYLQKTKMGWAMRASAQNLDAAMLMGINVNRVYTISFGLGSALSAAAGSLISSFFYIYPTMGMVPVLKAFVVTIFGGLGSIPGAFFGGFVIGIAECLAAAYVSSAYKDAVGYIIMVAILILMPSGLKGLFGRRGR